MALWSHTGANSVGSAWGLGANSVGANSVGSTILLHDNSVGTCVALSSQLASYQENECPRAFPIQNIYGAKH